MNRVKHPGIHGVGRVLDDGQFAGWGLTYCNGRCHCHNQPVSNNLVVLTNSIRGELGLQQFRICSCCVPWTVAELRSFLHELAAIEALTTSAEGQPS